MSERGERILRLWLGGTITVLWSVAMVLDMLMPNFDPPRGLGSLILAITTALFGQPVVREVKRRARDNDE